MSSIHRWLKLLAAGIATLAVAPWLLWFHAAASVAPARRDQLMRGVSQAIALFPGLSGSYLRCAFYRHSLTSCTGSCFVGFGTIVATADISLGEKVYVGPFCNIGHVDVGSDVLIGSNVTILSGKRQHGFERVDVPMNQQEGSFERIRIGDDCWLGNGSIIMADVAAHSIVAAGAIVTKAHPQYSILAGNPASVVARRAVS